MIPDAIVEEVRARADIVEVVGEHVALKKAGKEFRGLCPFHKEKTASFFVVPAKGFYKCFGCGESGDAFGFLMKTQGLGFTDAVRHLASKYGVVIPAAGTGPAEEPHRVLYEAVAFAVDHFRAMLQGEPGQAARRYLEGRGIGEEAAERFQLGWASDTWDGLMQAASRQGIEEEVLIDAGLAKRSERTGKAYDTFRGRVTFPIAEVAGRVAAFGGRLIAAGDDAPKYLNSPESAIYHKGRILYGLNWSRHAIRREGEALVVEGYMDYVALAAHGIEHVAAPLGTAMTEEQAALLRRYARKAVLLYDSDAAGQRASFRSADALLRAGVHPYIVTLPEGEDPDSLVRAGGAAALAPLLKAAKDVLERKLEILAERGFLEDAGGARRALDALMPTLRATVDPALRDIYIARVEEKTGVRRETLERELASPPRSGAAHAGGRAFGPSRPAPAVKRAAGESGQRKLLLLLLRDSGRILAAAERVRPEEFTHPVYREIFEALTADARGGDSAGGAAEAKSPESAAVDRLSPPAAEAMERLRNDPEELAEADRIFEDVVNDIIVEPIHNRLDELRGEIRTAESAGDEDGTDALMREQAELLRQLRSIDKPMERLYRRSHPPAAG